jgi:DNA repair protein RadA/Sms
VKNLYSKSLCAKCLNSPTNKLKILSKKSVETICSLALKEQPKIIMIDSIQVMHMSDVQSAPGSISQVRECASYLTRFAKQYHIATLLVRHVTNDGSLAGPKALEHCIDCTDTAAYN